MCLFHACNRKDSSAPLVWPMHAACFLTVDYYGHCQCFVYCCASHPWWVILWDFFLSSSPPAVHQAVLLRELSHFYPVSYGLVCSQALSQRLLTSCFLAGYVASHLPVSGFGHLLWFNSNSCYHRFFLILPAAYELLLPHSHLFLTPKGPLLADYYALVPCPLSCLQFWG